MKKITPIMLDNAAITNDLSIYSISDPSKILESRDVLDKFTEEYSKNPFLFAGFISQFMKSNRVRGWTPFILVVKANEQIVGTVPLMIKNKLGMRFAQFCMDYSFCPDIVVNDRYRNAIIGCIFEYLFKTLNCRFVNFYLSSESPNLKTIKKQCKVNRICYSSYNQSKHFIIPVEATWGEFLEKKGRRRIIRQIERKMDELGEWEIEYVENVNNNPDIFKRIIDIEKKSWKGHTTDVLMSTAEEILMAWKGSQIVAQTKTDFKCSAWFLLINGEAVAYTYVIKYKGTGLIHKTSYIERYKKFYVGKYIVNVAICDMFNEGQIKTIDFMGDFAFMSFWTSFSKNYVKVMMRKGTLALLVERSRSNTFLQSSLEIVLDKLPNNQIMHSLKNLFL